MTRKEFRRARVLVKLDSIHATSLNCCAPGYGPALRLALDSSYDALAARLSGFTTTARGRITLYPLPAFN